MAAPFPGQKKLEAECGGQMKAAMTDRYTVTDENCLKNTHSDEIGRGDHLKSRAQGRGAEERGNEPQKENEALARPLEPAMSCFTSGRPRHPKFG